MKKLITRRFLKVAFFSESAIRFSDLKKKENLKNYPEHEI